MRQKAIEHFEFSFIRINPDVEIATIYNLINKSSVKLAVNSTEKSLREKFTRELLSYMSSICKPLNYIRYFIKKILPIR